MMLRSPVSPWHATPVQGRHHHPVSPKTEHSPPHHHNCRLTGRGEEAEAEKVAGHGAK